MGYVWMFLPVEADARSEKTWVSQQNWRTSDTIQRHISGTTEDLLIVIVRSTLALISPSSWKTLICWKVHHRFDKGRWWNREFDYELVSTGCQISASNDVHEPVSGAWQGYIDIIRWPEAYPKFSSQNLRLCPQIWIPLFQSSVSCHSLCYPGLSWPFGSLK